MTDQEKQAALDALSTLKWEFDDGLNQARYDAIKTIRAALSSRKTPESNGYCGAYIKNPEALNHSALSSPAVPVIEGLDEAIDMDYIDAANCYALYSGSPSAEEQVVYRKARAALQAAFKAARAYAALPKMQKVNFEYKKSDDVSYHGIRNDGYNAHIDEIKSKYGELYTIERTEK